MINTREQGGLNVPDFDSMCKSTMIKWVRRYLHTEDSNWRELVDHTLYNVGGRLIFNCNLHKDDCIIKKIDSTMWKNIVKVWCELNYANDDCIVPGDIIWLNSNFEKILYNRRCIDRGLLLVKLDDSCKTTI